MNALQREDGTPRSRAVAHGGTSHFSKKKKKPSSRNRGEAETELRSKAGAETQSTKIGRCRRISAEANRVDQLEQRKRKIFRTK